MDEETESHTSEKKEEDEQHESEIENAYKTEETELIMDPNYDDDFFGSDEYVPEHTEEREKDDLKSVSSGTIEWEKEAKKTVHMGSEILRERRKTIYELDSYASSGLSINDLMKLSTTDVEPEPKKPPIRYSVSMGVPGIARIDLSPLTQKVIGCVIGENVSTEYPWVYVRKEIIEDNIDLHEESSDFLPVKDEIRNFPDKTMLIGYVPSLTEEGQFYICLTEEGRDAVVAHIQKQREEHENRVRTAVYKTPREWKESELRVKSETTIVENTRPLLDIEVVSTGDVLNTPLYLEDRKVSDQKDGYVELLPYRQTYENISRKLLHNAAQVTPAVREAEIQTILSVPMNCWVQYEYEYQSPDISSFNEEQIESFKEFLHRFTDEVCDQLLLNATWDIYKNDYGELVRHERDTRWPIPAGYKEHLSFHDEKHVVEKVINDLCWHPLWTGIAFVVYTRYGKNQHLVGPKSHKEVIKAYENNYVLVWSFNDSLTPKLLLECPREVTCIAVNPLDGSRIIGGCANGQIVLWDIPGKIEQIETVIVNTAAQIRYKRTIRNLTAWMQEPVKSFLVRPTAMSSLKDSQKAAITHITWISPYSEVDENGRITSLPEDENVDDLMTQFVTSSEDGTIAFWDLKKKFDQKSRRAPKKKFQTEQIQALMESASPYKSLDRVLKPYYILTIQHPNESRKQVITTLALYVSKFEKERVDVSPPSTDVTIRRYYRNIIKKPDFVMETKILVGTVEGEFGCITWEGYEFATGLAINNEVCKWSWIKKVHDGPVVQSVRSKQYSSLVATVGGKIFAVWRDDIDMPLMWKKSDVGLTACSWGSFRPTVLILTRMDGSVEIWDFMIKTQEPCVTQSLSGRIITGIYTHELYLNPQCVGICDFNGILRVFLAPDVFLKTDSSNIEWMREFIERQIERVKKCKDWQKRWKEMNYENIEEKHRQAEDVAKKKKLEEEEKAKVKITETEVEATEIKKTSTKRWELIEEARERWKERELNHMQQVILEKKGLRKEDLEKQREPILKMRQDAKKKKEKLHETLNMQEEIFEHTKSIFMPKHKAEPARVSLQSPSKKVESTVEDAILQQEVEDLHKMDPNEEILYNFMETQAKVLDELKRNPFEHSFDWRKILTEGKSRRISIDSAFRKLNKSRRNFTKSPE